MSNSQVANTIKTTFFLMVLLTTSFTYGQYQKPSSETRKFFSDFVNLLHRGANTDFILTESEIKGSPYLSDEFLTSSILTKNNIRYTEIPLRFNIYNNTMEFQMGKDSIIAISNPEIIKEIILGDEKFVYSRSINSGYYSVLNEGEYQLLLKYNVRFEDEKPAGAFEAASPPQFKKAAKTYFIKKAGSYPAKISKKKDFDNVFGTDADKALNIMKKFKLKIKLEKDLLSLVEKLNKN